MATTGKTLSKAELNVKTQFISKMWSYLDANFHKFSQGNQIKIALSISQKNMPTQIDQNITLTTMPDITLDGTALELNIGKPQNRITGDVSYSGEVITSDNQDQ